MRPCCQLQHQMKRGGMRALHGAGAHLGFWGAPPHITQRYLYNDTECEMHILLSFRQLLMTSCIPGFKIKGLGSRNLTKVITPPKHPPYFTLKVNSARLRGHHMRRLWSHELECDEKLLVSLQLKRGSTLSAEYQLRTEVLPSCGFSLLASERNDK